jgi:hypothetical protein
VTWTPESAKDMSEKSKPRDPIPEEFGSIEAAAEFWDAHSLADYWDQTREVHFDVDLQRRVVLVPLEQSLADRLAAMARRQGLSTETLVNLWLSERL